MPPLTTGIIKRNSARLGTPGLHLFRGEEESQGRCSATGIVRELACPKTELNPPSPASPRTDTPTRIRAHTQSHQPNHPLPAYHLQYLKAELDIKGQPGGEALVVKEFHSFVSLAWLAEPDARSAISQAATESHVELAGTRDGSSTLAKTRRGYSVTRCLAQH